MSEFSTEGHQSFPSLHTDNERIGECTTWDTDRCERMLWQYGEFAKQDLMPRAREQTDRIIGHLIFELFQRDA